MVRQRDHHPSRDLGRPTGVVLLLHIQITKHEHEVFSYVWPNNVVLNVLMMLSILNLMVSY